MRRVLVLGMSARAVAESVHRAGCRVYAADCFGDCDLLAISDWQELPDYDSALDVALAIAPDSVLFASGIEGNPGLVAAMRAAGLLVLAPSVDCLLRCRDPMELDSFCARGGFARPKTMLTQPGQGRFVVKSRNSGAGFSVRDWREGGIEQDEYWQEYIEGIPLSALFLADGRRAVLVAVSRQYAGEPFLGAAGYAWCGNIIPYDLTLRNHNALAARLSAFVSSATEEFGLAGACGADFILKDGEPWFLEFNPRICASYELVELVYGLNSFSAHENALNGQLPETVGDVFSAPSRGKGIVYAPRDLTAPDTVSWYAQNRRDIPRPGAALPAGLPICTVITPPLAGERAVDEYLRAEALRVWGECR